MPSSYSANLKIELQATGENAGTWGTITNTNLGTALEQAIVGYAAATFPADADLTLTYADTNAAQTARALVLTTNSSVSLSTTRNLIVPAIQKQYVVQNGTTGGQSIVVKTPTGTGITVPNGRKAHLYVDGTNVVVMDDYIPAGSNNSYAIAPNLLVGTTTGFTSTGAAGGTALAGYGIYPFVEGYGGGVNPAPVSLVVQNQEVSYNTAPYTFHYGAVIAPSIKNTGTSPVYSYGLRVEPTTVGTTSTGTVYRVGVSSEVVKWSPLDISTSASNRLYGNEADVGHYPYPFDGTTIPLFTNNAYATYSTARNYTGTINYMMAYAASFRIGDLTTGGNTTGISAAYYWTTSAWVGATSGPTATLTNAYGVFINSPIVQATGTLTNYYAFFATAPTVTGTGTLTNRWGIYIADASSPNYFAGSIRVGAGTVAAPTLTTIADTNTGIFFPAADNVSVVTGGAERVRVNSSGNVGFGYPAQTWGSGALALQLGPGYEAGAIVADAPANIFNVVHNARWDGTNWIYSNSAAVSRYFTDRGNGAHVFQTAPVGTQYTTVTLSERLRIKQTGQVRFFPLAAAPSGAENGDVYYDSTTNKLRVYAGGVWTDLH